ncbi:hypothetical protein [Segatella albensis]|jgi:hypothetical protein|uniref:hypothetical protein n=1 Tax=Segatella albensis TaxID=77768 RepID=UPI00041ED389|nr:hypothetical protein [Segatella albensis]
MKATEQTIQQIGRFINKIAEKFPLQEEINMLTDIHIRVSQDNGDMIAYDDNDHEITRCVIEQWIECKEEAFYDQVLLQLRSNFKKNANTVDNLGLLKPYSFVLENDDCENMGEIYMADDDTVIIGGDIMPDLDKDLDNFLSTLLNK